MVYWNYLYAGLRIVSALPIPEWTIFEQRQQECRPDVIIALDDAHVSADCGAFESWIAPDDYQLSIPETGVYRIRGGREITVSPMPHAAENEIRLFLLGSAWSALCSQRGLLALHASVIGTGEDAVAFCGVSGAGKSTLAAALIARGYSFVGDDLCCFDLAGGAPRVYPSAPRLKLWGEALDKVGWNCKGLSRDHFRTDKFHKEMTGAEKYVINEPLCVRSIYLLEWGDPDLKLLTGLNALSRLIRTATYRPEYIKRAEKTGAYWEQCARLAQGTEIWELKRMRDWKRLEEQILQIEEQLQRFRRFEDRRR